MRWNAWWFSINDDDVDGLAQYNHPYPSDLDDGPLWDHEMPVESPDLNTYLCVQMGSLAVMVRRWEMLELIMSHPGIYEYYNTQTGQPPSTAAETFEWTAAVFIDLAIQASREEGLE